jgi:hypothetical protein
MSKASVNSRLRLVWNVMDARIRPVEVGPLGWAIYLSSRH